MGFLSVRRALAAAAALSATAPLNAQPPCESLPPPVGEVVEVRPSQAPQLAGMVASSAPGVTFLLHDGFYALDDGDAASRLVFRVPRVSLRSASGKPHAVVLDGGYLTRELVSIQASDVTVADLTLQRAYDHPIHVSGLPGAPISGTVLHNLRIVDPGEQAVKINPVGDGWADRGIIECSHIELTLIGRSKIRNDCYTGGIDAHAAAGWIVRRNRIEGFWCPAGLAEHAIHFWRGSRDTLVEQNVVVDCARGIGFGLGEEGGGRDYPDDPYPGLLNKGHIDGVIRNNFVAAADGQLFGAASGFDTGIGLEQAAGARVLHNTVASTQEPRSSSIEWRFSGTFVELGNNLGTHRFLSRDGGRASLVGNLSGAPTSWLVDVAAGDLHLSAAAGAAVNGGAPLAPGWADLDIDLERRDAMPDVGADESGGVIFFDGFESGDLSRWSRRW